MKNRAYVMILTAAFLACGPSSFAAGYLKSKSQPAPTAVQAEPPAPPIPPGSLNHQFAGRRAQTKVYGFSPELTNGVMSPRDAASSSPPLRNPFALSDDKPETRPLPPKEKFGSLDFANPALLSEDKPDKPQPPKDKIGISGNGYAGMELIEKQLGPKPKFDQWKDAFGHTLGR